MADRRILRQSSLISIAFVSILIAGCSSANKYISYWQKQGKIKSEFKEEPTTKLLRELDSSGNYLLVGNLQLKKPYDAPVLIVPVSDRFKKREIVTMRIQNAPLAKYYLYLPDGSYDLCFFADINRNGFFEAGEMVGNGPVKIKKGEIKNRLTIEGPAFTLDVTKPAKIELPINVAVKEQDFIVASLDEELFDYKWGQTGLYDPKTFITHTQRLIFSLEKFDSKKTIVLFVHGVCGSPRDFKYLVDRLDRTRYQPYFLYYPSGLPLKKLGSFAAETLKLMHQNNGLGSNSVIVVAHSMGGLISLSGINELCHDGAPSYLKGFISINSPYGGMIWAQKAIDNAPVIVESWRDVAPGSLFLKYLYSGNSAAKIPFYLIFGYKTGESSDGTVTLQSQLEDHVQAMASKSYGFNADHVGILSDENMRRVFYKMLDSINAR